MQTKTITLEQPLTVVGLSGEVEKPSAQQTIGALWGQAAQAGALSAPAPSYGVYSDYQDKLANRYRVTVGQPEAPASETTRAVTLPAGEYVVFEDRGPGAEVAARLWRHVWTKWPERDRRTFDVDFERYEGSPDEATVSLYIGVTPAR